MFKELLRKLFSKNYLSWEEYEELVAYRDFILFQHYTAVESYKNLMQREAKERENVGR